MHRRRFAPLVLLLLAGLFMVLPGCSRAQQDDVGVVARVNGKPITLDLLEFQYDILHFNALSGELPSVGALREAYGEILGQLIAQELVAQELKVRGQEVSDEELQQAEAKVRGDYPEDAFEQMLAEEFLDIAMWRKQLRYACGIEKFQRLVLRPSIHLDHREVEAYYQAHLASFRLPERVRVLVVRAQDRAQVEKALGLFRQQQNASALAAAFPAAQVREVVVPRELLTPAWADALHGADAGAKGAGGQGAILSGRAGYEGLLLLERLAAETMDIPQAYPQVEAALLEERLQQAFDAWLGKALDAAVVRVNKRLLHKKDGEDLPPEPAPESTDGPTGDEGDQQDIASGNETG
jgi:hypothetical protein